MTDRSNGSTFFYVIYIRTTADKLWTALTEPEFTKQYWFGMAQESTWKVGADWQMRAADNSIRNDGIVLESDRPRRLVLRWRYTPEGELREEGESLMTIDLEPVGEEVKLTLRHEIGWAESKLIATVSTGWPRILSNLKSLLETGSSAEASRSFPVGR